MRILRLCIIFIVLSSIFLAACGGNRGSVPRGLVEVPQPNWYGIQGSADYVFTYGTAERVSQQAAETSAYSNAVAEAARFVEVHVQAMTKDFISEAGVENPQVLTMTEQVIRTTANQTFSGTQITQRRMFTNPEGRYVSFIQVAIPKSEINRDMMNRIKNEEALYNQFRASQSFAEMDKILGN